MQTLLFTNAAKVDFISALPLIMKTIKIRHYFYHFS
jgi:hypothetical protein